MDLADLTIESRSQTPEQIKAALESAGYETTATEVTTDAPKEDPAPAGEAIPAGTEQPASTDAGAKPAGSVEGEPPAVTEEQPKPPKTGAQRNKEKIARLKADNERLARELDEAKRKPADASAAPAATAKTETTAAPPAEAPKPAALRPKPTGPDELTAEGVPKYSTYEDYSEDMIDWKVEKRELAKAEEAQQTRERDETAKRQKAESEARAAEEASLQEQADRWTAQITDTKSKHPDFDTVIQKEHAKTISNDLMLAALRNLDDGSELVYWLATHPEEAIRIQELTAFKAGASRAEMERKFAIAYREFGKIVLPATAAEADDPEDEDEPEAQTAASPGSRETPATAAAAAAPAGATPPAKTSTATATAAEPKHTPPSIVGGRGASRTLDPTRMKEEQLRTLPPDEYRKAMEARGYR